MDVRWQGGGEAGAAAIDRVQEGARGPGPTSVLLAGPEWTQVAFRRGAESRVRSYPSLPPVPRVQAT